MCVSLTGKNGFLIEDKKSFSMITKEKSSLMDSKHGSGQPRTVFHGRKHGFQRKVDLLTGRVAFSTKKNRQTNRNQSIINTENGEKNSLNSSRA